MRASTNAPSDDVQPALEAPRPGQLLESPHGIARLLGGLKLDRYSGILMILVFIVAYSIWLPDIFPTTSTVQTVLSSQAVAGLVALAVLFPLAAGAFDLSVAQNVTFSSLVCAVLMTRGPHFSPLLAIVITIGVGGLIGVVNGWLVAHIGLNSFIATLGTTSLLTAGASILGNGQYLGPFPESFTDITSATVLGIPITAIYLLVVAGFAWYVLEHSKAGRRTAATGLNPEAARLAGINTRRILFMQMVVCGALTALAAVLLTSSINTSSESVGSAYLLPAYAAAFLGTTQIKPGRFNVWGTLIAIYLLGVGVTGLQLGGANVWVTYAFNGVALLAAVSIAALAARRAASGRTRQRRRALRAAGDAARTPEAN
ncbi:ABC transporter permease [Conexibacter sp. CPCC 206217]|uniref:ABC transporter permease n=1 Tax=Conexibacter sp. CPCC 206217 TaxID=3064574 RepID=UPI002720792E|nr:ABC transporter permease [Conexibacter sp. CPCC 206217]MDO8210130.1 ABC transporter permease [Conexibacter sp. CPCC 206217]